MTGYFFAPIFNQKVEYWVVMELDHTLMALADPTRRAIFARLIAGEARVTEIAAPFDMSLNAVSKHVKTLERAFMQTLKEAGKA